MADCDLSFLDEPLPPGSILRSFPCGGPSAGPEAVDLVSLQESFLTALERSDDIAEHAKIILDSVSAEKMELEKGVTAPDETNNNPPRGRRPGMGRKKARFSMRPTQSQNLDDLIPNLDTENLADPDEYFAAVDKIEAAKREINRLKGQTSPNAEERVPQGTKRERRPGLGIQRKKLGYVHLGPTTEYKGTAVPTPEGKKTLISSPVNVTEFDFNNSSNNLSLPGTSTRKDAIDSKLSNDDKHKGSGINKESSVRNLLDSLLSSHQSLEGEDGMKLLQEKLQLKQMNVEKIRLPDYLSKLTSEQDITNAINGVIQEADAGFNEIIPRKVTSNRPPLSAISPLQNNNKKPRLSQLLSSLCNSPLAAMAMLQKKVSLADSPISAAYSSSPIDDEIGSGTPNAEEGFTGKEASKYSSGQSRFISSQFEVDDQATDGPTNLQNLPSNKPETPLQNENDVASSLSHFIDREIYHSPEQESEARSPLHDRIVKTLRDDSGSGPVGDNVECLNSEVSDVNITAQICTPCDIHADRNQQPEVDRTGDHDLNIVDSLHQGEDSEVCKDQQPLHASTDQENGQPNPISQAKKSEETPSSRVLVKKKACRPRKKWAREVSRRKSLASAGTKWKAGVRRSSRHKIKPLEFWRGERVLYGRIHESLATVIGVKCSSPGGDTALKVKSYVPDKYKDLVELAARY